MTQDNKPRLAACDNDSCPSRTSCLRWHIGRGREEWRIYGQFAPKSKHAQKCKFFMNVHKYAAV